jgi:hypothetical protein
MYLLVFLTIFALALLLYTITEFYNIIFRRNAPFISTKNRVVKLAVDNIQLNPGDKVFELGCGKARLSRALAKKFPRATYFGFEYSFFPYLIARILVLLSGSKVNIQKKNFFKLNFAEADLIYCYLLTDMMTKLSSKITSECRPGTKIVSHQFTLPGYTPKKIIQDKKDRVYFYKI